MKGNTTVLSDLMGKKKKKIAELLIFFLCPVFELYQSENHCYSKSFALFCLEAQDLQCQLSPILLDSKPASQPAANQWVDESEWSGAEWSGGGVSTECLFAVVLCGVRQQPHSAELPPGLHFLHLTREEAVPPQLANRGISHRGGATPPSLSTLTQRSL